MTGPAPTLLRGALVLDGTGRPGRTGDVLLAEGRIQRAGGRVDAPGARVVDADGLALAPGFIDMHAHSDLAVLTDPVHLAKVSQGVTTEVVGQDGLSYAPATPAAIEVLREQLAGWNGVPSDLALGWETVGDYLAAVDAARPAANVAALVPQGTVRLDVVGAVDRPAADAEIAAMRALVDRGMRDGAFGMSSGLTYVPGMFAGTDELVALCEVVAAHGGVYVPHQRSYGAGALEAYAEMIEVARRSGVALHLAHATMNFGVNRGRAGELVALLDAALASGVDLTFDTYPYLPGSTTLAALLPSWAAAGGPAATLDRLRDPASRARIAYELDVVGTDGCHGVPVEWETIEISGVRDPALSGRVGHTVAALAAETGRPASTIALELLVADRLGTGILQHVGDEANVRTMMAHPRHTGGSDGILVGDKPHPRAWGTFPRYLGHYVREENVLRLEDAIVHLSARPAALLGLTDRGRIAPGMVADLVLFDPATVADRATFAEPRQQAAGIPWVFVAGEAVIADGRRTEARPGRALRHPNAIKACNI
ncbi:N-acyl-D-amino-acid deacylase family protein [Leifsonia aquatica]|uniref:N-acyl-D-amino-acid deacylase n=2 Tax=Leifsonia aquatica TaxID=144185 RepID=A0A7W4UW72_LEIAQ|nr:D-aminoacylase [Leifsonia aquatica]MBB2967444.1 N-acyl-D-amino-acid deacylase [Leifsonia aquatica]